MKDHYESYWGNSAAPPDNDPLSPHRQRMLWEFCRDANIRFGARLVDAGCGNGQLCNAALAHGLVPFGIDISANAIARARATYPGIQFLEHALDDGPWPVDKHSVEVVCSFEVIEHLLHPADLIRGAHSALVLGGHLAISTPFHGRIKNLAISTLAFEKHFNPEGDHIRFFTDRQLQQILAREGFEVLSIRHLGRAPLVWANSFVWARKV